MHHPSLGKLVAPLPPTALFSFTDLREGAGTEKWILNVASRAASYSVPLSVVQTTWLDHTRLAAEDYENLRQRVRVLTLPVPEFMLAPAPNNLGGAAVKVRALWVELVGLCGGALFRLLNQRELPELADIRILYCIRNDLLGFVPINRGTIVVGSSHMASVQAPAWLPRLAGEILLRIMYRRVDAIHYLTESARCNSSLASRPSFFVPYGVDSRLYHPGEPAQGPPVRFLFVARLERLKGVEDLLEVWKDGDFDRSELHIVGRGSLEGEVARAATQRPNVVFHRGLPEAELAGLYGRCDVFVFPSRWETFGAVVLEALSSGLFVIAGERLRPTFDEFELSGALAYAPYERPALKNAMVAAMRNVDSIRARKGYVHELVRARYDWDVVARDFFTSLAEVGRQVQEERERRSRAPA